MFKAAVFLALLACAAASFFGINTEDGRKHYHFPCKGLKLHYDKTYDIVRGQGNWYDVDTSEPISNYHWHYNEVQALIDAYVGCATMKVKVINQNSGTEEKDFTLVYRKKANGDDAAQLEKLGFPVEEGRNEVHFKLHSAPAVNGDNGHMLNTLVTTNFTITIDTYMMATDYTNYRLWYYCMDIPVGHGVTYRADKWGVASRWRHSWAPWQLFLWKMQMGRQGVHSPDPVFHVKQDMC